MKALTITEEEQVSITDGVLFINTGYRTSNMIPINNIFFVDEIRRIENNNNGIKKITLVINDSISIESQQYKNDDNEQRDKIVNMMCNVHTMIRTELKEFHSRSIKLDRPKQVKIESEG